MKKSIVILSLLVFLLMQLSGITFSYFDNVREADPIVLKTTDGNNFVKVEMAYDSFAAKTFVEFSLLSTDSGIEDLNLLEDDVDENEIYEGQPFVINIKFDDEMILGDLQSYEIITKMISAVDETDSFKENSIISNQFEILSEDSMSGRVTLRDSDGLKAGKYEIAFTGYHKDGWTVYGSRIEIDIMAKVVQVEMLQALDTAIVPIEGVQPPEEEEEPEEVEAVEEPLVPEEEEEPEEVEVVEEPLVPEEEEEPEEVEEVEEPLVPEEEEEPEEVEAVEEPLVPEEEEEPEEVEAVEEPLVPEEEEEPEEVEEVEEPLVPEEEEEPEEVEEVEEPLVPEEEEEPEEVEAVEEPLVPEEEEEPEEVELEPALAPQAEEEAENPEPAENEPENPAPADEEPAAEAESETADPVSSEDSDLN